MTSTQSSVDVERLTSLYLRFSHGDVLAIDELFAENINAHLIGDTLLAANYAGKPAIREFIVRTIEMNNSEKYRMTVEDTLLGENYIAFVGRVLATDARTGETSALRTHDVFHLDSEGKADEMWSLVL